MYVTLLLSLLFVLRADGDAGDFAVDFAAAEPYTYSHSVGGGSWNDGSIGQHVVESLEGGDFACGDIVTYLAEITVDDGATTDTQTLNLDFSFLADCTGKEGVGHGEVLQVAVNYGDVGGTGAGGGDSGMTSGGKISQVSWWAQAMQPAGTTNFEGADALWMSCRVNNLEAGEVIILRIDVLLTCLPGSRPTGNLQAKLEGGQLVAYNDVEMAPETMSSGAQTIPFKQINMVEDVPISPSPTPAPTPSPTKQPTSSPTPHPTKSPTVTPVGPTPRPTKSPTGSPTPAPPTSAPTPCTTPKPEPCVLETCIFFDPCAPTRAPTPYVEYTPPVFSYYPEGSDIAIETGTVIETDDTAGSESGDGSEAEGDTNTNVVAGSTSSHATPYSLVAVVLVCVSLITMSSPVLV